MNTLEEVKTPEEYLPVEQRKEVNASLTLFQSRAKEIVVKDDATMADANDLLIKISQKQKNIEQFRLAIVKPFKDHIKKIDDFFKTLGSSFDPPKEQITKKVADFRAKKADQERRERERNEQKAKEAEAAGKTEKAADLRAKDTRMKAPEKSQATESGMATWIKKGEGKVVNPDLLPDEFWMIDEKKLNARVREIEKTLEVGKSYDAIIPGVIITVTERPSLRGEGGVE